PKIVADHQRTIWERSPSHWQDADRALVGNWARQQRQMPWSRRGSHGGMRECISNGQLLVRARYPAPGDTQIAAKPTSWRGGRQDRSPRNDKGRVRREIGS